jgi:hypothetical protein
MYAMLIGRTGGKRPPRQTKSAKHCRNLGHRRSGINERAQHHIAARAGKRIEIRNSHNQYPIDMT